MGFVEQFDAASYVQHVKSMLSDVLLLWVFWSNPHLMQHHMKTVLSDVLLYDCGMCRCLTYLQKARHTELGFCIIVPTCKICKKHVTGMLHVLGLVS